MILYDYSDEPHEFDVDLDDEGIAVARLEVVSGDEVLEVIYKTGDISRFDSCYGYRFMDFHDATFILVGDGKWVVDKERFLARKGSYDDWDESAEGD